jgi:hypothetical protein
MGVFGPTVPRELYDDMKAARDIWQQECAMLRQENFALMRDVIAMKRHELGLPPVGMDAKDPLAALGPKTRAMIEKRGGGYADLTSHLTNFALRRAKELPDDDARDAVIADEIEQGEAE